MARATQEITRENFFDFTPRQLFDEIERLRGNSDVNELKAELKQARATISRVNNALLPPKTYAKRNKE